MNNRYYKIIAVIVAAALFAAVIEDNTIESKAFVMETAIAFELLQAAFMSVGITVVSYEGLKRLFTADGMDTRYKDIIDELNAFDEGLGTRLELVIYAANLSGSGWSISIDEETFDRLRALSEAIADGYQFSMEYDETQVITNINDLIQSSIISIPTNLYPRNIDIRNKAFEYEVNNGLKLYNQFMSSINNDYGAISAIYNYHTDSNGKVINGQLLIFSTLDGSPVAGAAVSKEDGNNYLRAYDADGMMVDIVGMRILYSVSRGIWTGPYNTSKDSNISTGKTLYAGGYNENIMTMLDGIVSISDDMIINNEVKSEVKSGVYDVVTPGRTLTDVGSLAGNIVITIPHSLDLEHEINGVVSGVFPLTEVLPKIGVYPVDTAQDKAISGDKTIAETIAVADAAVADVPAVGQYDLGLASFFPFCIPFDFASFIQVLKAEPEAPSFTFKFPTGFNSDGVIYTEYEISLEQFDTVAYWCRKMELLAFIIGLMLATRPMFIRS